MSEQTTLGVLLDATAQRDAIHIAVAPVIAAHILSPGEHVGFISGEAEDRDKVGRTTPKLGIVDPFLQTAVMPGQRFWLFLYPQTITSLRHNWTHPAFAAADPGPRKSESEQWLRGQQYSCLTKPKGGQ